MQVTTRQKGDVFVLDLDGNLIAGGSAIALRDSVGGLLAQGGSNIVLNMAGIRMMDSSGLGELSKAKRSALASGGDIKLLNVSAEVSRVLDMANRLGEFAIFHDETVAVASFAK